MWQTWEVSSTLVIPVMLHSHPLYRIMQIVRSGKASRLADLSVIRGKTFTIVQQFETPYNKKDKNSLENLRDWRLIRENLPPRTICIIRYD